MATPILSVAHSRVKYADTHVGEDGLDCRIHITAEYGEESLFHIFVNGEYRTTFTYLEVARDWVGQHFPDRKPIRMYDQVPSPGDRGGAW